MAGAAPPVYRGTGAWGVPDTGYAGGIQPHGWTGGVRVQPGWVGGVRVGYQAPGAPPAAPAAPWQPPPIPPGFYNPTREIEAAEGKSGTEQTLTGLERRKTNEENAYATNLGLLGQREQEAAQKHQEVLKSLTEAFARQGVRQGEAANRLGVVNGGTLIASATQRAANEAKERAAKEAAYKEQLQGFEDRRGELATGQGRLVGPGGQLTEEVQNARLNEGRFQQNLKTLEGIEAARNGYRAPTGPIKWSRNPVVRALQAQRGW